MLSKDFIQRVLQLRHIVCGAGIQGFLHHRLFGKRTSAKGLRPRRIASQTGIDFYQPMGSGKPADESILELVSWGMLDGFPLDLHRGADQVTQLELTHFHSNGGQRSTAGKMSRLIRATLVHDGGSPLARFIFYERYGPSSFFLHRERCLEMLMSASARLSSSGRH